MELSCVAAIAMMAVIVFVSDRCARPMKRYDSLAEAEEHGPGGVMVFAAQGPAPSLERPDAFLLEAMLEVDAMLPDTPPLAPPMCKAGCGKPEHKSHGFCCRVCKETLDNHPGYVACATTSAEDDDDDDELLGISPRRRRRAPPLPDVVSIFERIEK